MTGDLVPFGKYKGEPVEVVLSDRGYIEWLLAQPWVRDRYPTFHQTIINYGGEPSDTPEHNAMQAAFLDDAHCLALARLLFNVSLFDGTAAARQIREGTRRLIDALHGAEEQIEPPRIYMRRFEKEGWDVTYELEPANVWIDLTEVPPCVCGPCDHARDCDEASPCRGGVNRGWGCKHSHGERRPPPTVERLRKSIPSERLDDYSISSAHCDERCVWSRRENVAWFLDCEARLYETASQSVQVECKPDLGDDFPKVLRQVCNHGDAGADKFYRERVVLVRRHAFEQVTWEQVIAIFAASGVRLVAESDLQ